MKLIHLFALTVALFAGVVGVPVTAADESSTPVSTSQPYFQNESDQVFAIKEPMEANKDKQWLGLRFPETNAARVPIVVRVESDVMGAYTAGVANMLENSLMSSGRFRLFDSQVTSQSSGARFIVTAQLVEYSPFKKGRGIGGIGGGLIGGATHGLVGGVGIGNSTAEVAIAVRLIDARSGEVLKSAVLRGKSGNTSFSLGGAGGGGSAGGGAGVESWQNGAVAAAAQIAVNKASLQVYRWLDQEPVSMR